MRKLFLGTAIAVGLGLSASAATIEFEGNTYSETSTVLKGRNGETTRGYFYFDPCSGTYTYAAFCFVSSGIDDEEWFSGEDDPNFATVWMKGFGPYIMIAVDFTPVVQEAISYFSYEGEITVGVEEVIDEYGNTVMNTNEFPTGATVSAAVVPLPATLLSALGGIGLLAGVARRRR